jgi:hypothetical protein
MEAVGVVWRIPAKLRSERYAQSINSLLLYLEDSDGRMNMACRGLVALKTGVPLVWCL